METDPELLLTQLLDLGFELGESVQALEACHYVSLDAALEALCSKCPVSGFPQSLYPAPVPPQSQHKGFDPEPRIAWEPPQIQPRLPSNDESGQVSREAIIREREEAEQEEDGEWSDGNETDTYRQDALLVLQEGKEEEEMIELVKPDRAFVFESAKVFEDIQGTVADLAETLEMSFGDTARMLQRYRWDIETVHQQFFKAPDLFQHSKSLPAERPSQEAFGVCPICDRMSGLYSIECGHFFCKEDWEEHIQTKIRNNEVDQIGCMQAGCKSLVVNSDFVKKVSSRHLYQTFLQFLVKKIVDTHPLWKRCPAPNCSFVFKLDGSKRDVRCMCNFPFCTLCSKESHIPCTCDMLTKWEIKNKSEGESTNWILVNTQMCPKCKWPIEKNGGCNHMTCRQCNFEFCWICRGDWHHHASCNAFVGSEEEKRLGQMKESLDRYLHYYQRYETHERSKQLDTNLRQSAVDQMVEMQPMMAINTKDLDLVSKATENVIECRRILKYTYVYAFYYQGAETEKQLFEFLQAELERSTEELSEKLEARRGMEQLEEIRVKSNTAAK